MGVSYADALSAVRQRLSEAAAAHSVAVGEEAARIAGTYGLNPEDARLAGLLHDWGRELSGPQLVSAAREAGIPVTHADLDVPYLLHARVGALQLTERFPELAPHIVTAVERHTMGAESMAPLDVTVYVADMIEPNRTFEGVDALRDMVGKATWDELFEAAYAASLKHLVTSRKRIHPSSVRTWNAIVSRVGDSDE